MEQFNLVKFKFGFKKLFLFLIYYLLLKKNLVKHRFVTTINLD